MLRLEAIRRNPRVMRHDAFLQRGCGRRGEGEPAGHDHVADAAGELLVEGEVDAPTLGRFGCKYKCESFRSAGP